LAIESLGHFISAAIIFLRTEFLLSSIDSV